MMDPVSVLLSFVLILFNHRPDGEWYEWDEVPATDIGESLRETGLRKATVLAPKDPRQPHAVIIGPVIPDNWHHDPRKFAYEHCELISKTHPRFEGYLPQGGCFVKTMRCISDHDGPQFKGLWFQGSSKEFGLPPLLMMRTARVTLEAIIGCRVGWSDLSIKEVVTVDPLNPSTRF